MPVGRKAFSHPSSLNPRMPLRYLVDTKVRSEPTEPKPKLQAIEWLLAHGIPGEPRSTGEQLIDRTLVRRSRPANEAVLPTIETLDIELLPWCDTVHFAELRREDDSALGGHGGLHGGNISSYLCKWQALQYWPPKAVNSRALFERPICDGVPAAKRRDGGCCHRHDASCHSRRFSSISSLCDQVAAGTVCSARKQQRLRRLLGAHAIALESVGYAYLGLFWNR